jgi:hypothetical protein
MSKDVKEHGRRRGLRPTYQAPHEAPLILRRGYEDSLTLDYGPGWVHQTIEQLLTMKDGHVSDILALAHYVVKSTDCEYSTIPSTTARW